MQIDLTGKIILVTGASRGIGGAITRFLGDAGATVAIHYNQQMQPAEELAAAIGNGARTFQADLAVEKEAIQLFEKVLDCYKSLDGLINNAGIAMPSAIDKTDHLWLKAWHTTLTVNLSAAALLCKKAVEHFLTKGEGRIVNITSRAAFRGDTPEFLAYAASKGGLVSVTRSIARAYGSFGIKAFNIAPGFTETDMARKFTDLYGEEIALNDIVLNKLTAPNDIAPMVTLLMSGLADHATGCTIDINGGSYVH
ncbi:SDR family oxidoreductase [Fulvivirgaceae bacterium BMA12]|uniref:SDR family oxidoreductase n=1 Tax=Agaribacillus aureus TaxID=3051825 RepID=A0ABT8L526_9BACT|nr:SDR family oxidoreductase [Fulvivirgaceae bacterium BMA12]